MGLRRVLALPSLIKACSFNYLFYCAFILSQKEWSQEKIRGRKMMKRKCVPTEEGKLPRKPRDSTLRHFPQYLAEEKRARYLLSHRSEQAREAPITAAASVQKSFEKDFSGKKMWKQGKIQVGSKSYRFRGYQRMRQSKRQKGFRDKNFRLFCWERKILNRSYQAEQKLCSAFAEGLSQHPLPSFWHNFNLPSTNLIFNKTSVDYKWESVFTYGKKVNFVLEILCSA